MAASTVDLRGSLTGDEVAAVRALVHAETESTGVRPVSDEAMLALEGTAAQRHLLLRDSAGRLVAYGWLPPQRDGAVEGGTVDLEIVLGPAEPQRDPAATVADVTAILKRAAEVLDEAHRDADRLRVWARGERTALAGVLRDAGAEPDRELLTMRRRLDVDLPEPQWPDGIRLRTFRTGTDETGWLTLNNRAFAGHPDQSGWGQSEIESREAQPWFDPAGFFLAVEGDRLLGFHWTKRHPATTRDPAGLGEVYVLGVDPCAQGRHLGGSLLLTGLRYLRALGLPDAELYVEADNATARALYGRWGFAVDDRDVRFRLSRA